MKTFKILFLLIFTSGVVTSCNDDDDNTTVSVPVIESLSIQGGENIKLSDSIYFDAKLSDADLPLSTLEVELVVNDNVISSKSIRTKGNFVSLENISLFVPFVSNIATGDELKMNFTLINVNGGEVKEQKIIKAIRPELPKTLYLILSDKSIIELYANEETPYIYESEEGRYPSAFSTKIATSKDLADAEYVWNAGIGDNIAAIGDWFETDVKFDYNNWLVKKIIFDAFSFTFDIEGLKLEIKINDVQMAASGDYMYASVGFTKGQEFFISGIDNMKEAYNRDFFEYDAQTGKCTFIGESGNWDVYYSLNYNYLWVNRMSDVAPAAYWIIGHGFASTPKWYSTFNSIGWDLEDVRQLAYMYSMGSNKYQATVYLSSIHDWGGFDIQVFSNRTWDADIAIFADDRFTGDKKGVSAGGVRLDNILMNDGFISGYYRLILDLSEGLENAWMNFEKLSE
ncbi:MAG: DUF5016 domain-containing protein [Tannerellaceae bacterium]|jgi:hypothetical protein|nr:DUF5016 domain-containing protein [Tannerellaceae bacterium]